MVPITIIIADDHDLVRESWKQLLDKDNTRFKVIAVLKNGKEAVEQVVKLSPDIVLMDVNMSPVNGFEATERIIKASPHAKVIGISINNHPAYAEKMLAHGAKGYITKTSTLKEVKNAIQKVHHGETYICEEIRKRMRDGL